MTAEQQKALFFFTGTLLIGGALAFAGTRLLGVAAGPDADIVAQLMETEKRGLQLDLSVGGAPLVAAKHHFDRITVQWDERLGTATAVSTLDFAGHFGRTEVSSLGVERTEFRQSGWSWRPVHGFAPRLTAIVSALELRRRAMESGDRVALARLARLDGGAPSLLQLSNRRYTTKAWYIRTERDSALVTEDYRLEGALPDRPVDEVGTKQLELERVGAEFFFSNGLM